MKLTRSGKLLPAVQLGLAMILSVTGCSIMHREKASAEKEQKAAARVDELMKVEMGDFWKQKVAEFRADNPKVAPGGIVLFGDSIIAGFPAQELFPGQPVIKRGISGDTIIGLLHRMDESVNDLRPKKVFVFIGLNDIVFSENTVRDYRLLYGTLFDRIKQKNPDCRIYVQSLIHMRGRFAKFNSLVNDVNKELRALARERGLTFIDIQPLFRDENGEMPAEYSADGVHPNQIGYQIWAKRLANYMK